MWLIVPILPSLTKPTTQKRKISQEGQFHVSQQDKLGSCQHSLFFLENPWGRTQRTQHKWAVKSIRTTTTTTTTTTTSRICKAVRSLLAHNLRRQICTFTTCFAFFPTGFQGKERLLAVQWVLQAIPHNFKTNRAIKQLEVIFLLTNILKSDTRNDADIVHDFRRDRFEGM